MSKFTQIIIEMSLPDAMKMFNISKDNLSDKDLIKKVYRELSVKHHPDRGGDEEMMKKINDAKSTLDKYSENSIYSDSMKSTYEEYERMAEAVKNVLLGIQTVSFIKHFEKIFGGTFNSKISYLFPDKKGKKPSHVSAHFEFFNSDKSIMFMFEMSADLHGLVYSTTLGSGNSVSFPLFMTAYGIFNDRKIKMTQKNWAKTSDHAVLKNPELSFPTSTLVKYKSKEMKFQKKDMITILVKRSGGDWDGKHMTIPLVGDMRLWMNRMTFMGQAAWYVRLYRKYKEIDAPIVTFPEDLETTKWVENLVIKLKKLDQDAIPEVFVSEMKKKKG